MDLHGFDLNLLVALDALLRERSVTNAGRRVHLSQSAMSGALARLRHAFNDELLVSGRGGMTLTPLGESLLEPVASILRQTQETLSARVRFDPATSQRAFTIAASDYATTVLLDDALRDLSAQAPHVTVVIAPLRDRMEEAEDPDIDLYILPQAIIPQARPHELLFYDTFTCLVWREHPEVGDRLTLDQFTSLGHVVVSFSEDHKASDDRLVPWVALERRAEVVVPNFHALPGLVIGTKRIATIQLRLAKKLTTSYPVRIVGAPVPMPRLDEAMMWHPRFEQDPAHVWLRALLKRTASEMPAESDTDVNRPAAAPTVRRGSFGRRRV
jgi:LysR family transcriptional regulator, nod-box dependent transcriptional activator